jgi:hypothetical protein
MRSIKQIQHRTLTRAGAGLGVTALAGILATTLSLTGASAAATAGARAHHDSSYSFALVPSPNIANCLPHASGKATITTGRQNDTMKVSISGMPAHAGFDLFVIQQPLSPFGVSWYQTDIDADADGSGSATVKGVFDVETFSVSPGGTVTFSPTHQYHLGLWFNNPQTPFKLGCEPGATTATVTPFNGEQHAGVQALNTSEFPADAGPLSNVSR